MRRIAVINQKGGVGKTTTTANLGAALAQQGRRVVVVDMDAQANLSLSLNVEAGSDAPSTYTVLTGATSFAQALQATSLSGLSLMPSNIDLSGAELELASVIGREYLMKDALAQWESEARARDGHAPADYVIFDCPPSLGLLSINALAAAGEVLITLQTEFLALQGMSKLVEVVQLLRRRLNPELVITGILPCLYDSRLKLAREVLGEIRAYFPGQVFPNPVRANVKLAEAPSYGKTIFEYAPDSNGAADYRLVAREVIAREARDPDLAHLPPFRDVAALTATSVAPEPRRRGFGRAAEVDGATPTIEREATTPERVEPSPSRVAAAEPTEREITGEPLAPVATSIDRLPSTSGPVVASSDIAAAPRTPPTADAVKGGSASAPHARREPDEPRSVDVTASETGITSPRAPGAHEVEASLARIDRAAASSEDAASHGRASRALEILVLDAPQATVEITQATTLLLEEPDDAILDDDATESIAHDDPIRTEAPCDMHGCGHQVVIDSGETSNASLAEIDPLEDPVRAHVEPELPDTARASTETSAPVLSDSTTMTTDAVDPAIGEATRAALEAVDARLSDPSAISIPSAAVVEPEPSTTHGLGAEAEAHASSGDASVITAEPVDARAREALAADSEADDGEAAGTSEETLRDVVLTPTRVEPAKTERRIVRAEDLPPLPPDAFEILTSYVHER